MQADASLENTWHSIPEWNQFPFICRCWIAWCRYGLKRSNGFSFGGTAFFRLLRGWLKCHPVADDNFVVVHSEREQHPWMVDLLDLETYIHTMPRLSQGAFHFEVLKRLIRPGMSIIDCGANAGLYAFAAAQATGSQGRVLAFEPQKRLAHALEQTRVLRKYNWVEVHAIGLSDYNGQAQFETSALASGVGQIIEANSEGQHPAIAFVPVRTLDSICADQGITGVDVIKLDVEGAEYKVLSGASKLLSHAQPLLWMEWNSYAQKQAGISFLDMIQFLHQKGYSTCYGIMPDWPRLDAGTTPPDFLFDVLAVPARFQMQVESIIRQRS